MRHLPTVIRPLTLVIAALVLSAPGGFTQQGGPALPSGPLKFAAFAARFGADGTFSLEGAGWPPFKGTWKREGAEIELLTAGETAGGCDKPGRYRVTVDNGHVTLDARRGPVPPRRMILDRSLWRPRAKSWRCRSARSSAPAAPARATIARRGARRRAAGRRSAAARALGRGRRPEPARSLGRRQRREHPVAHADRRARALEPDRLGQPHLRHDRGQQPIRTRRSARASMATATRPTIAPASAGLIYAIDKRTGKVEWERVALRRRADRQAPHQVDLRERHAGHRRPHRRRLVRIAGRPRLRRQRDTSCGRSISGTSTSAPTTSRRSSGARRARRSSGTAWSSCRSTRRPIRSCSR